MDSYYPEDNRKNAVKAARISLAKQIHTHVVSKLEDRDHVRFGRKTPAIDHDAI